MECVHIRGPQSTLTDSYATGNDGRFYWWTSCRACGKRTDICLTEREASERAVAGWWNDMHMEGN